MQTAKIKPSPAIIKMLRHLAENRGLEVHGRLGDMMKYVGAGRRNLNNRACVWFQTVIDAEDDGLVERIDTTFNSELRYRITPAGRKAARRSA